FSTTLLGVAPKIDNYILSTNEINITFSEQIYPYSNASIISSNNLSITSNSFNDIKLNITFSNPLDSGIFYPIKIQNIKNCLQATLIDTTINIIISRKAKPNEVIISEIYADETPSNGLPEGEFVELFNTTNFVLDLSNFKLKDATTTSGGTIPNGTFIQPKSYLILSNTSKLNEYTTFGNAVGVSSFPSLNATGDEIILLNHELQLISKVVYSDSWYKDQVKQDGGYSLEKIDFENPCETAQNWSASVNSKGGTPGKPNSIQANNPNLLPPQLMSCFALDSNSIELSFDDIIDDKSVNFNNFFVNNTLKINSAITNLYTISLKTTSNIYPKILNLITIVGIKDCATNQIDIPLIATFVLPEVAQNRDILINEILFNPFVGGSDFVEIYNNSNKNVNLKNWKIANYNSENKIINIKNITNNNFILKHKSYVVLTTDILNISNLYPKSIKENLKEVESLPTMADDKGSLVLLQSDSLVIDNFNYLDDFHYDLLEKKEGVSLERINFNFDTNLPDNWQSAAATIGYATPGFKNSQSFNSSDIPSELIKADPLVFSPDEDGFKDFTLLQCNLPENGYNISVHIYDYHGTKIKTLANNILSTQFQIFKWDGIEENGDKAKIGSYMVVLEGFNLLGSKIAYKTQVVVAGKF
ncbi:MAG: lamin tail domain-containing protein, partial [Cytophagales bacterium]